MNQNLYISDPDVGRLSFRYSQVLLYYLDRLPSLIKVTFSPYDHVVFLVESLGESKCLQAESSIDKITRRLCKFLLIPITFEQQY